MTENQYPVAIILAGGFGTRMRNISSDCPKPLIRIGKYNLLENNLLKLKKYGINDYIFSVGYLDDKVREYFGNGSTYGINIEYIKDPKPLGDAGAFRHCFQDVNRTSVVINSDDIRTGLEFGRMLKFHRKKKSISTIAVIRQEDIEINIILEMDTEGKILKSLHRPSREETSSNYANSGFYIMEKEVLNYIPKGYAMFKDILGNIICSNKFYGFIFNGLYFNVGTPEILNEAKKYQKELEQI